MADKAHDKDSDKDGEKPGRMKADAPAVGDDIQSLRERIARLEGMLAAKTAQAPTGGDATGPSGPKYRVLNPQWSQFPAGHAHESQLGGPKNVERLLGLGHIAPLDEPEADAPKAE